MAEFMYMNQWLPPHAHGHTAAAAAAGVRLGHTTGVSGVTGMPGMERMERIAAQTSASAANHSTSSFHQTSASSIPNALYFDFNGAYSECINELDQALKSTKSQKLRDLIATCMHRLQQLKDLSDSVVKHCHNLQEQLRHTSTHHHPLAAHHNSSGLMPFSVDDPSTEIFYQDSDHSSSSHRPLSHHIHQQQSTIQHTQHQMQRQSQHQQQQQQQQSSPRQYLAPPTKRIASTQKRTISQTSSVRATSQKLSEEQITPLEDFDPPPTTLIRAPKHKKDPHQYRPPVKKNQVRDDIQEELPEYNPSFERIQFDKEEFAREALQRARTHDFGVLTQRYSYQAIMELVESGAKESIKGFLTHGMVEQFHDLANPKRPSYRCKEPECDGLTFGNHLSCLTHCLKIHMNNFRPCACKKCDAKYFLKLYLRYHQSRHTKVYRLRCPHEGCQFTCNRRADLNFHVHGHDKENKKYTCPECGKRIINSKNLQRHRQKHKGETFSCDWEGCSKIFPAKYMLRIHRRLHENIAAKKYKCQFCEHCAPSGQMLRFHMRSQHSYPTPLTAEEKAKRWGKKRVQCEKCGKSLMSNVLKRHLAESCGKEKKIKGPRAAKTPPKQPVTCPHCQIVVSKHFLPKHMRKYHEGEQTKYSKQKQIVRCSVCDERVAENNFKRHFQRNHPKLDWYPGRAIREGHGSNSESSQSSEDEESEDTNDDSDVLSSDDDEQEEEEEEEYPSDFSDSDLNPDDDEDEEEDEDEDEEEVTNVSNQDRFKERRRKIVALLRSKKGIGGPEGAAAIKQEIDEALFEA